MAKTDWQMGDTVQPDDLNQIGEEINKNAEDIADHKSAAVLDHPDGSVTTEKLADGAVTAAKVAADVAKAADLAAHANAVSGAHGATSVATANRIIQRDAAGRAKVAAPDAADDIARKDTVDAVQNNLNSHMADYVRHPGYAIASGSANTYSVTLSPAPTTYLEGMAIAVKINVDNTGASTINVNGLGSKTIKKPNGSDVSAGNLKAGSIFTLRFNGTNFILQGEGGAGTAQPADVLSDKTFTNDTGEQVGTMPNRGNVNQSLTNQGQQYTIPAGYHGGGGKVTANISNLSAANIVAGKTVGGISGTFSSDATATASQILSGQTAYVDGSKVTGTMTNRGAVSQTLSSQGQSYTIPAGYHNGSGKVTANISNLTAANIKAGATVGGVTGTFSSDANATTAQILSGRTAYVNGSKLTGTMANRTGAVTAQAISRNGTTLRFRPQAGYYPGDSSNFVQYTDANFIASNILKGVNLFGLTGTARPRKVATGTINIPNETPLITWFRPPESGSYVMAYPAQVFHGLGEALTSLLIWHYGGSVVFFTYFYAPGIGNTYWRVIYGNSAPDGGNFGAASVLSGSTVSPTGIITNDGGSTALPVYYRNVTYNWVAIV